MSAREIRSRVPGLRAGFTLIELVVVALLGLAILTAVARTLSIQGRGFEYQATVVQSQSTARMVLQVVANELKEVSATGGDLLAAGGHEITLRSFRQAGVICDVQNAPAGSLDVWGVGGEVLADDSVLVFLNGDPELTTDDRWVAARVATATAGADPATCTPWAEYSLRGDPVGVYPTQRLTLAGPAVTDALPGGLVRSFERVSYALTEAAEGWALTRRVGNDEAVPLVANLAPPADSGLAFTYFDTGDVALSAAAAAAAPTSIGRITVTVKTRLPAPAVAGGNGLREDRLVTSIYLRSNRVPQFTPPQP